MASMQVNWNWHPKWNNLHILAESFSVGWHFARHQFMVMWHTIILFWPSAFDFSCVAMLFTPLFGNWFCSRSSGSDNWLVNIGKRHNSVYLESTLNALKNVIFLSDLLSLSYIIVFDVISTIFTCTYYVVMILKFFSECVFFLHNSNTQLQDRI